MLSANWSYLNMKTQYLLLQSSTLRKWWPLWLFLPGCLASWTKYIEEYDSIRVARCDVRCGTDFPDTCMESCLASNYTKPGYCPNKSSMTPFEAACLIACIDDSHCPDFTKCCNHDCGVTCMHPLDLNNRTDLPPIPQNLQVKQQKSNLFLLIWDSAQVHPPNITISDENVRYLVEERHLLGPRYLESRLSLWSVRHISTKPQAILRNQLKTGHWYQFRVAAINENGSRGYSQPSRPFKTKEPRNPKEPQNLTLSGARMLDEKLRITLGWVKPVSDIPITFYKVFWSRLVHGPTNDSILVYQRTVLKDQTCYEFKNLEPKCQYFLQVQAVALYGGRRLTSRKASKVFNTTDYTIYANGEKRARKCERYQNGLHLRRLICDCGDVKARLVWSVNNKVNAYNVSWTEESCSLPKEKYIVNQKRTFWKIVQTQHCDLQHLRSQCMYSVNVRNIFHGNSNDHGINIEFFTSRCQKEYYQKEKNHSIGKVVQCKLKSTRHKRNYFKLFAT